MNPDILTSTNPDSGSSGRNTLSTRDILSRAGQLSDAELLAWVKALVQHEREATAVLVAHLAVMDERELHRAEGYPSMFSYCTRSLHFSEDAAYWRIKAARAARRFPVILDLLAEGSVHLTAVVTLAPHLTAENYRELLRTATHQTKEQVEELVAALRPQPDVRPSIRRLPAPSSAFPASAQGQANGSGVGLAQPLQISTVSPAASGGPAPTSRAKRGTVEPLAPQRYKIQFAASAALCAKLRQAQDLLRHQIPDGDLEQVMDRALTALLEQLAKQKFAATNRPRSQGHAVHGSSGSNGSPSMRRERSVSKRSDGSRGERSRHIPAEVKRAVRNRDGQQCTFVSETGHRCPERGFLEFHHVLPYSLGGQATVENIQLRCRAHNGFEAERDFGRRLIQSKKRTSVGREGQIRDRQIKEDQTDEPGVREASQKPYVAEGYSKGRAPRGGHDRREERWLGGDGQGAISYRTQANPC